MSQPATMPQPVRIALGLTLLAAAIAVARTIVVALVVDEALIGGLFSLVVVVMLTASAFNFAQRRRWARMVVIAWSVISAIASVSTLVLRVEPGWYLASAAATLLCGVALIVLLLRPDARDWFTH